MNILAFISGFSAHIAEDIEENTFYKREFKKYGNKLFNIFRKYENQLYSVEDFMSKEEEADYFEEITKSFIAVEHIIRANLRIKNDNQREYFNDDLQKLFDKYSLDME